jgi:hypothetical protein
MIMAKNSIPKTNVARLMDQAKVPYELIAYPVDENDLSAIHVAACLGEDIEQVFKTLVLHGEKSGYFVCVIPGEHEVDLKMAAKVSGNKKCDLIPMKELLAHRHEEAFPHVYPQLLPAIPLHLCERRHPRIANQTESRRPDPAGPGRGGRPVPNLVTKSRKLIEYQPIIKTTKNYVRRST